MTEPIRAPAPPAFKRVRSAPEVITRVHSAPQVAETARLNFRTHRILYPEYLDARGAKEIVYRGFINYPDKIGPGERWFLYYWKVFEGAKSAHTLIRVVARYTPDWSAIPTAQVTSRDISIDIYPSMTMHFELRTFPHTRVPRGPREPVDNMSDEELEEKRPERRKEITDVDEQRAWLARQTGPRGFSVDSVEAKSDVMWIRRTPQQVKSGKKDGWRQPYTDLSGTITIQSPQLFRDRFFDGIGPEKAFGFGLLVLQPTR